jgi:hypothetical protein
MKTTISLISFVLFVLFLTLSMSGLSYSAVQSFGEINAKDNNTGTLIAGRSADVVLNLTIDMSQAEPGDGEIESIKIAIPKGLIVEQKTIKSVTIGNKNIPNFTESVLDDNLVIVTLPTLITMTSRVAIEFTVDALPAPVPHLSFIIELLGIKQRTWIASIDSGNADGRVNNDSLTLRSVSEPKPGQRKMKVISSESSPPDSQTIVQLSITDATGISSGDITIKYDPNILSVGDIKSTQLTSNMSLTSNTGVSGQIKIAMAGANVIPSGIGSLIDITFTVNSKVSIGTETVIQLVDTELYDTSGNTISISFEDGIVKIRQACVKGDVNNDGKIKSSDATLILRIVAGLLDPDDYQKCAADVNGDGLIRSNDATIVLRKAAGFEAPVKDFIADKRISISLSEAHGLKGETISVPITVDNIDILSSGDMSISYNSKVLRAIDVLSSDGLLMANNISQPGLIRISFAVIERLNDGKLAEIRFEVLTDNVSPLTFKMAEFYGTDALPLNSKFTNKQFRSWAVAPELSALLQNYPNPFNPETWIPFQLMESGEVSIFIYSVEGKLIRELKLGYKPYGIYASRDRALYWDGKNEAGEFVASGIYFYAIQTGDFKATRKMTISK